MNNETIADIVAEIRAAAYIQNADTPRSVLHLADRIEAAVKREELRWAKANGELAKMLDCEKAQGGIAAAMREALVSCMDYLQRIDHPMNDYMRGLFETSYNKTTAALSKPPRNCDVGTADEQAQRYDEFCAKTNCAKCPVKALWKHYFGVVKNENVSCGLIWANMPYEEGCAE